MNRARWITSIVTLSALWLMGALVLAPRMQNALETAAREAVEGLPAFTGRASRVKLVFQGQQAHLSGAVRTAQDRSTLEQAVSELVRAPTPLAASLGLRLNPVSAVHNEIEVAPLPPGWLLLAATGPQARLLGAAASEHEARDLARSVQENWGTRGGVVRGVPQIDAEYRDEAASVSTTLRGLPPPQNSAQTLLARIGQPWKTLRPDESDTALLAEARLQGVTEVEWREHVLPALQEVRAAARAQQAAEIERHRQAALPRGHVFIATRGGEITLRGEVGDAASKRGLLDETLPVFAPRQVHDEIRVSPRRRPGGEFAAISTALLPGKGAGQEKTLYLGFEGGAWKAVDWQVAGEAQPWKKELPADVDAALIQQDSNELIAWLQGAAKPRATLPSRSAFITLAVFGGKAVLCGQVGEESTRSQLIAAARRAYAPRILVLHDELRLDAGCLPARGILNTVKSLPLAPPASSEGIFAIATPGSVWAVLPVTRALVEAGGLTRAPGLPDGLSASLVEERSIEAIEQLRHWISHLPPTTSTP
jgi:osmotically-inducible protein OsmY